MSQPIIHGDLVDAAAALVLADRSDLMQTVNGPGDTAFECEPLLFDARTAAAAYLVACFNYAATAADDEAAPE